MRNVLSMVLLLAVAVLADWDLDTATITGFRADSTKYSVTRDYYSGMVVAVMANDTTNDTSAIRFYGDSAKFEVGCIFKWVGSRRGSPVDTIKTNKIAIDTVNFLDTTKFSSIAGNSTVTRSTNVPSIGAGMIDTSTVRGFGVYRFVAPDYNAQLVQFYVRALAGTRAGSFVKVRLNFIRKR